MNAKEIWHGLSDGHWLSAMLTPANRNRLMKLALAIADQVAFSGSNFVFSVLLGRWMLYETYGAFTYAYSILILLASFHNALLLEPFTVFGSSQYRFTLGTYTDRMARLQWYWGVVISGISLPFGLVLWAAGNRGLGEAMVGMAIAQGAILYFWYVRRKWYVLQHIERAVIGTTLYAVIQIVGAALLHHLGALTPLSAFATIGAAGLIAGLVGQSTRTDEDEAPQSLPLPPLVREHWQYGKWLMIAGIFAWLTGYSYNVLTGSILSLADTGGLKALQNLINPVTQLLTAFNLVFIPWIARRHAERGSQGMNRDLALYAVFSTGCAALYWVALSLFREPIFSLLYGGRYTEYSDLLPALALIPLVSAFTASWTIGMRVLRQTQLLFWVDSIGAAFTITVGVLLVVQFGLSGAVAGSVISTVIRIPVLIVLWRRATKASISEQEPSTS